MTLPICESFLGAHYRRFFEENERRVHTDVWSEPLSAYAVVNDLGDEMIRKLREWQRDGFPHVCGKKVLQ